MTRGHLWSECELCGWMVICRKCGNNTCNGGRGEIDGNPCDMCDEAYEVFYSKEGFEAESEEEK